MDYSVRGLRIHSQNAAKPISQASHYLLNWIRSHEKVITILDYGCGKMRYSAVLLEKCRHLTLVDSDIQLSRVQLIDGRKSSVREQAANLENTDVLTIEEFYSAGRQYDFILCANVLSAIPSWQIRHKVVRKLRNSLADNGECLFVTQFRDAYFSKMATYRNALKHMDGILIKSPRGNSFYGIIKKVALERLVKRHRLGIKRSWLHEKSAYVLTGAE